ncbi:MAG: hypothetical protein Q4A41_01080, partial [Bacillota bacterium]|nr:hypothetical protein [Bacillota bacterium]
MSEVTSYDINRVRSDIQELGDYVSKEFQNMGNAINIVNSSLHGVSERLNKLSRDFYTMIEEQRRHAALQNANTNLLRVRQEIADKFSGYKEVRDTMLGVLQATDLALVRTTTISRVSEEIMISTPEYWLAPCLVAVAAWIGNDRALAERAIEEAMKRDEEKTAITMALICRRAGRTQTCYEWLSIYFSKQSFDSFSEGSLAYIDAYVNGVFGSDEKNVCGDYIVKWMNEVKKDNNQLELEQIKKWSSYYQMFKHDLREDYPHMNHAVEEFSQIDDVVGRINSVDGIRNHFSSIAHVDINTEVLRKKVDSNLIDLIERYDSKEDLLRTEELMWMKAVEFGGDTERATDFIIEKKKREQQERLNLVEQMTNKFFRGEEHNISEKRTAVTFLQGYIEKAFDAYVNKNVESFPEEIHFNVGEWSGSTSDASNIPQLMKDYEQSENARRQTELAAAPVGKPKLMLGYAVALGIVGLLTLTYYIGIAGIAAALYFFFVKKKKAEEELVTYLNEVNRKYDGRIVEGKAKIAGIANEWSDARSKVEDYKKNPTKKIVP